MAGLILKLLKYNLDAPVVNAVVVAVRQVSDSEGRLPETAFETLLPIPAGPTPPISIEVPEGRYSLVARAPGGETDRRTVRIVGDGKAEVTFDLGHSPREWLSWSTLSGALPSIDGIEARSKRQADFGSSDIPLGLGMNAILPSIFARSLTGGFNIDAGYGGLGFQSPELVDGAPLRVEAVGGDRAAVAWRIVTSDEFPRFRARSSRPVVRVLHQGGISVVVVPGPWTLRTAAGDRIGDATAKIDIVLDFGALPSRAVRVVLHEPEFVALLGYLGAGRMSEAAASLGASIDAHVTRLIREKIDNPLAAAGAAYVGLATTGDEALRELWAPWLRNLMNWFEDLPDGAILFAKDRIERGRTPEDLNEAKAALKVAFHRGLPVYSAGFRHLLSGLQLFSDDEDDPHFDPEMLDMYSQVAEKAALADPTQPFTVLTFRDLNHV